MLAGLCQRPEVLRAQVLVRTRPAGAAAMCTWWSQHALGASPWAGRIVDSLVQAAEEESRRTESLLALTLRAPRTGRRGLDEKALEALDQQSAPLADSVRAADLDVVGWLDGARLAHVVRAAYDPYSPVGATASHQPAHPSLRGRRRGALGPASHRLRRARGVSDPGAAPQ